MVTKTQSKLSKIGLGSLLFFLVFGFFVAKIKDWRFYDDDYGAIFFAKTLKKATDFETIFLKNHNDKTILPSNILQDYTPSRSTTTLRPMALYLYYFSSKFLDIDQPLQFFLFSCALHALAAMLLFFVYQKFLETHLAFIGALLFGLFPFSGKFIGRIVIAPYSCSIILHLLSTLLLTLNSKGFWSNKMAQALAITFFCASLFFHEVNITFIFLYALLSSKKNSLDVDGLKSFLWSSIPYFLCVAFYAWMKAYIYPSVLEDNFSFFAMVMHRMKYRFFDLVTLVMDILGYSFIPGGNRLLKTCLLLVDCAVIGLLFKLQKVKNYLFLGALTFLCLSQSWPSIFLMHVSRYLYFVLPYFLLLIFFAYQEAQNLAETKWLKSILKFKLAVIFIGGMWCIQKDLNFYATKFIFTDNAIKTFATKLSHKNNLCFIGLPFAQFQISGLAQAIWLYTKDFECSRKIYYDFLHTIRFTQDNPQPISEEISSIETNPEHPGFITLKTNENLGAYVEIEDVFENKIKYSMGSFNVEKSFDNDSKATEIKLFIASKYEPYKIVTWSEVKQALVETS